ncbi:MAG: PEGA domain-containing protein [Myxococcota bacterium]|nr:PEGA domain-containing protein [Myxococcota bacterium]
MKRTLVVGRYECVERLATGPLGEMWRAKRYGPTGVEGQFVLWRLHALRTQDPGLDARLQAAVQAYRALECSGDGVPRLCEVGESGPHRFLVFDVPCGISVSRLRTLLLAERPEEAASLLPRAAAFVGRRLAELVQVARDHGLSPQGLDPDAVLVDESGRVWVMALGLTGALLPHLRSLEEGPLRAYLAPEVLQGEAGGSRSDVYSLGALVQTLLTGAAPGQTAAAGDVPSASEQVLASVWRAVERALAPQPADRPADAAAFAALLPPEEAEQEVRLALARLATRRQRLSVSSVASSTDTPVVQELVLQAASAESLLPPDEPPQPAQTVVAPAPGLQPLPPVAPAAIPSLSGIVLAVEEEEHTVPVPHSPKSQIKVIEAEPPVGVRPAPVPRGQESAPSAEAPGLAPSMEMSQRSEEPPPPRVPTAASGSPWPVPDALSADESSGQTQIVEAAEMPSRTSGLPGRENFVAGGLLPAQQTPEPEFLEELQMGSGKASAGGEQDKAPAAGLGSPPGSGEDGPATLGDLPPPPVQSPSVADGFPPLVTDPVPRIPLEAGMRSSRRQPPPPPQPRRLSLPSLSQDEEDSVEGMIGEDDPTRSIPDAPARRLAALAEGAPSDAPISSAPPPPPARPRPLSASPSPPAPVEPPPSSTPALPTPAPVERPITARRGLLRSKSISPAVVASFVIALLIGGSVPVLVRALRRPPRLTGGAASEVPSLRSGEARPAPPASAQSGAPARAPGTLELSTTPAGATVFVDGKPAGRTPLTLNLGDSKRKLVIMAERYQLIQREVDASASPLHLNLQPVELPASVAGPARLKVRCSTKGQLRIFVDGHDSGYSCPSERINLSPGTHKVEFFRPHTGDRVARTVTIKKGKSSSVRLYTKF